MEQEDQVIKWNIVGMIQIYLCMACKWIVKLATYTIVMFIENFYNIQTHILTWDHSFVSSTDHRSSPRDWDCY